jgi:hypothetical protein
MKRWAIITVFLYALICAVAMVPLVWGLLYLESGPDDSSSMVWTYYSFVLIWVGVLTLCQALLLLLLVPLDIARERPV